MTFISTEESTVLILEFLTYAFGEMCLDENWRRRIKGLCDGQHIDLNNIIEGFTDHDYNCSVYTLYEIADLRYNGNIDDALERFFLPEIRSNRSKWFEAWVYTQRPDLDTREEGVHYWDMWQTLTDFTREENFVDMLKEHLGLNVVLK
jgi:hypothetical protein